jgi:uncharacterized 2Fe-2S/4Fe-4S cluster protein (DUF4445 family)
MSPKINLTTEPGQSLLEALRQQGSFIPSPCGGKGICGKCHVEVEGIGTVRACSFLPEQEVTVEVPVVSPMRILTESFWPDPEPRFDRLPPGTEATLGLAVDIGTTTVVVFLEDLESHRNLGVQSFPNPQQAYGADVISRIHYCIGEPAGTEKLRQELLDAIAGAGLTLCSSLQLNPKRIGRLAFAGNTTMQHIARGVSPEPLAVYPFTPVFLEEQSISGFIKEFSQATAELIPSLTSYIGADIVAGFAAVSLNGSAGWKLFLDIGTNGEMVLWNGDRIFTCATAAGPAFEGARISCGMAGVDGAVCALNPDGTMETIGNKPPVGLCGSGLVDAVALLLESGVVDSSGYMEDGRQTTDDRRQMTDERGYVGHPSSVIRLLPQDIRELQLAKGAIAAGIEVMMTEAGIGVEEVGQVFLAGGFGYALHDWSAARIGLIPAGLEKKLIRSGNTAGLGARLWLHSGEFRDITRSLTGRMTYVELSDHPEFNDRFVMNMGF